MDKLQIKRVVRTGYAAMNKGDFDIENISFYTSKKKAVRTWGKSQAIVKVRLEFEILKTEVSNG